MYLTHTQVACPVCRTELARFVEEDMSGQPFDPFDESLTCAPATGGCGLVIADTSAESVEALPCAS